ncbi:MAG: molybdopterin-dependent oxidoreductase, partial [Desulfuromonadales bacterium]|nr:molybdopterin-dependent oxidoreductase [Desulfuromonadales bacterium]
MTFVEGPVLGLQMSCMVKAQDGMVVATGEERAADLRKHVAEWLMTNHPHDCPVCDEGGECLLQDMTVAAGHGIRRYRGRKRTYNNQYLGPFLWHEMNRCIQCYRCVRTYQDYCGGTDFGVLGCNQRIYFGRFRDGTLASPFSGNLADVCPTGVFTDKTFRYRARYWDLQEAPSVCPHCSLGCALVPGARYRELQRVRGGTNRQTNGWFICDRGRFGYGHANHPQRPRRPRVDGREASWAEAAGQVYQRLRELTVRHGAQAVALLGSPRASLEANAQLRGLARDLGTDRLAFDPHPDHDRGARTLAALLGPHTRSLQELRDSDCLLLVGIDPLHEGPGLALAARQAVRRGASVAVLDPRPVELPFAAVHLPLEPQRLGSALAALSSGNFDDFSRQQATVLAGIAARLRQAQRPLLAGGIDLLGGSGIRALLTAAGTLESVGRPCGAAVLLGGPNSFGAALLAGTGPDADELLTGIEEGGIKALLCLECDPLGDHPNPGRVKKALAKLELLVVLDCLPTATAAQADLFLPTTVPAESAGTYVNNEGRMLPFASVFEPGIPLQVTGGGDHPPRHFELLTPGSEPRPAWAALAAIGGETISLTKIRLCLEREDARFAGLHRLDPQGTGQRVAGGLPAPPAEAPAPAGHGDALRLLATAHLFGSEALAACSPVLDEMRPAPYLLLHVDDAARLGLVAGDRVRLTTGIGEAIAILQLSSAMPPGLVIAPRLRGTPLELFVPGVPLPPCRLEKE